MMHWSKHWSQSKNTVTPLPQVEANAERRGFYRRKYRPPYHEEPPCVLVNYFGRLVDRTKLTETQLLEAGFRPQWLPPPSLSPFPLPPVQRPALARRAARGPTSLPRRIRSDRVRLGP